MKIRQVMAVKLHGLCVRECHLYYSGSIVLPENLCSAAGLREHDRVWVYNFNSGARYDTYVLYGPEGLVSVNGPSARLSEVGDRLVIVQYLLTDESIEPKVLFLDSSNRIVDRSEVFDD